MSENFIFAYVGISVPLMINDVNIYYVLIGIVALLASRLLSVMIVSICVNPFKTEKITFSHQIVMTFGGLRGAVAFYLALNVSSEYKHLIITTTISLILFTVIGMGSATPFVLKWLHKKFPEDEIIVKPAEDELPLANNENYDFGGEGPSAYDARKSLGVFSKAEEVDKNYLQRYLRKDGWKHYGGDGKGQLGSDGDIQVQYQEMERRVTKNYGDLSPHRKSNLVNQELQNRMTDSKDKNARDKRPLTPPGNRQGLEEREMRGILKGKSPRKESNALCL